MADNGDSQAALLERQRLALAAVRGLVDAAKARRPERGAQFERLEDDVIDLVQAIVRVVSRD